MAAPTHKANMNRVLRSKPLLSVTLLVTCTSIQIFAFNLPSNFFVKSRFAVTLASSKKRTSPSVVKCELGLDPELSRVDELLNAVKSRVPERWTPSSSPFESSSTSAGSRLPLPGFNLASVGLRGRWRRIGDNFVLYPLPNITPRAVIHFIGGAFVGAAPHFAYRYLLDELADEGYIVITTPYKLSFNYIELCADIRARLAPAITEIDAEFGRLPTIGFGHSCGALLHALLSSLFSEEDPESATSGTSMPRRAANILVSYNNKPARESIPQYERSESTRLNSSH